MGQSVHGTGFRLVKWKNWDSKGCVPEKERYLKIVRKERMIQRYILTYFDYVLPRKIRKIVSLGTKDEKRQKKVNERYHKEVYGILKKKWAKGIIGDLRKDDF